jgi:hypothetical protein
MSKKYLSAVISILICTVFLCFIVSAATIIDSGNSDDNLTWKLDNEGTLTVSGTGAVSGMPWYDYCDSIKTVIIENGITSLRNCAFFECHNLEKVFIPPSVIKIDGPLERSIRDY